jgi:hypothetical protein
MIVEKETPIHTALSPSVCVETKHIDGVCQLERSVMRQQEAQQSESNVKGDRSQCEVASIPDDCGY